MQLSRLDKFIGYRELLTSWTLRIIKVRYQQSILGGVWAIFQPLALVVVFTIVFTRFIQVNTGAIPYAVFSYTAMVPWMLFSTSMTDMVEAIVSNMNLVAKIYFPREILVIASLLARLMDFAIAFGILILLMGFYRLPIFSLKWLYLPLILLVQLCLGLGLGLMGAALNVFYRDIKHLFALLIQIWFYATPIIYPVTLVPERWRTIYFLNPMAGAIEAYRAVLLYQLAPGPYFYLSAAVAMIILLIGFALFRRLEYKFADVI